MPDDLFFFLSYVTIAVFTPGPNNITSASMGLKYGYRKTLPFLLGIGLGFLLRMSIAGLLASWLTTSFPGLQIYLNIGGALYILYLAWKTLKASYETDENISKPLGFWTGAFLQLINPKGIIFALTVYTSFLSGLSGNLWLILVSALSLVIFPFAAVSSWTLFGTAIKTYFSQGKTAKIINAALAILLFLTALEISGLWGWVRDILL